MEKYRHDLEVVRDTAAQVIKDFAMISIDFKFSGKEETAYEELKAQMIPALQRLYENDSTRLKSLYYRVDISEKKLHALPASKEEMIPALADLILERELIKVITRKLFSNKK